MSDPWTLALPADLNSCVLTGLPLTTPLPTILIVSSLSFVVPPEKSTARIASPTARTASLAIRVASAVACATAPPIADPRSTLGDAASSDSSGSSGSDS